VSIGGHILTPTAGASQAVRGLVSAPAFQALDPTTQRELSRAVEHVAGYLEADPYATGLAGPADLRQRMQQGQAPASPAPGQPAPAQPAPAPAGGGGSGSATGRVGEVTRATLNAIDFPQFVASLIQGTFKAIVDASIQQMEAYAALLQNVSATVDRFMDDNVTDGMARDHLTTEHPWLFKTDASRGKPQMTVDHTADRPMPSFLKDLGFDSPAQLDKSTVDSVVVPATRRSLSEQRQQTLATMVLMGINRVVIDDGEIKAKLVFHIDASETTDIKFDRQKATTGNMAGQAGSGMFNAPAARAQPRAGRRAGHPPGDHLIAEAARAGDRVPDRVSRPGTLHRQGCPQGWPNGRCSSLGVPSRIGAWTVRAPSVCGSTMRIRSSGAACLPASPTRASPSRVRAAASTQNPSSRTATSSSSASMLAGWPAPHDWPEGAPHASWGSCAKRARRTSTTRSRRACAACWCAQR
jgi:hypothetical protein